MKKRQWLVVVVMVLLVLSGPIKAAVPDSCYDAYQKTTSEALDDLYNCGKTAEEIYAWYDPRKAAMILSCSIEWNSDAIQAGVEYALCMSIDKLYKDSD